MVRDLRAYALAKRAVETADNEHQPSQWQKDAVFDVIEEITANGGRKR